MQEAMMKVAAVGPNHRRLDPLIGNYKVDAKFWMEPNGKAEVATGTAEFRWILGGHYVAMDYYSSFQGQKFEGYGLYGYNNIGGQYESTWVDSMGSEIMKSVGQPDKVGSAIVFSGEFECPIMNGPMKTREIMTIGTDRHVFEMYHAAFDGSGEYKAMEIVYERVRPVIKSTKKTQKKK